MDRSKSTQIVRTRFAPSPTGLMHIGGVRTALYAFLVAKKNNGIFYLRIEDTDRTRFVPEATANIVDNLKWLGLNFEGPVIQSERQELYKKYAKELIDKGFAYEKEGAVWFKIPKEGKIVYTDLIGRRKVEFDNSVQKDFVILKSDGFPTYHLAHVVDDHLMGINPVIRAEEWMSSIPKHILLFKAFGWEVPQYAHLPLILGTDRSKLSKRHGAKSVSEFRQSGFLPEAILNYMALLGWTPSSGKEVLTLDQMVKDFDLKDVHIAPAVFDISKLEWMNGVYIRSLSNNDLLDRLLNFDETLKSYDKNLLDKFVELAKTRMKTLKDFKDYVHPFMEKEELELNEKEKGERKELRERLEDVKEWSKDKLIDVLKKFVSDKGLRFPDLYKIIIGKKQGLPIADTFEILGKGRTLKLLS